MSLLKHNIFLKIGIIAILILVLLIPATMLNQVILEREATQKKAIKEVSSKWANAQTITGPYLSVPYDRYVKKWSEKDSTDVLVKFKEWLHILPEDLNVNGTIEPEKRYRGIFEVVVYESNFNLSGTFKPIPYDALEIEKENIHFDKASLNIGITDLRGIEKQIKLNWNAQNIAFNSGTVNNHITESGINASLPALKDSTINSFNLDIDLKGSQQLFFVPVGKTTDVNINSNWTTPSFTGNFLPDTRTVDETGFKANWNILHLNRNYPQFWKGSTHKLKNSAFGTSLLLPVDNYQKSYRVARYAILFLTLTFMVFFFVEILKKVFIHPIQYLLVGVALIVFYALMLAFSEHIAFNPAYILAAVLTLFLITAYTAAILKSKQLGMLIFGILIILYGFIFSIIQLEDYALLIGSLGIFIILGLVMYFSRKIDWYEIKIGTGDTKFALPKTKRHQPKTDLSKDDIDKYLEE